MGKKGKNGKRYRYDVHEFQKKFCSKCSLCSVEGTASFCYDYMYRDSPIEFVHHCYKELKSLNSMPENPLKRQNKFRDIFCKSGCCGPDRVKSTCVDKMLCISAFENQIGDGAGKKIDRNHSVEDLQGKWSKDWNKKKQKKNNKPTKAKVVYLPPKADKKSKKPVPCFFTNGGDQWLANMRKMLHGSKTIEQNTPDESSGGTEGLLSRTAETSES